MKTKHWLALVLCAALFALPAYAAARDQDAPRDAGPVLTAPPETTAPDVPMGFGKGDLLAAVAQGVFGVDLSGYPYLSDGELCDLGEKGTEALSGRDLALSWLYGDILASAQEGEKVPLGYFCQADTVCTVVERPDGDVALTEYLLFPDAEQEPFYQVASEQVGTADRALLDAVYAH